MICRNRIPAPARSVSGSLAVGGLVLVVAALGLQPGCDRAGEPPTDGPVTGVSGAPESANAPAMPSASERDATPPPASENESGEVAASPAGPPSGSAHASAANDPATTTSDNGDVMEEYWEAYFMQDAKVGYGHTIVRTLPETEQPVVEGPAAAKGEPTILEIDVTNLLAVTRFGERTEQQLHMKSVETADGRLLRFESQMKLGPTPLVTTGRVEGDRLVMETTTQGKTAESAIPWKDEYGGLAAVELSLRRNPLEPGKSRSLRSLQPGFYQPALVELKASQFEPVELLSGTYELLRIDNKITFDNGQTIAGTMWTDRTGQVLKHRTNAMNLEVFRTTKARALEETEAVNLDLGFDLSVPVNRDLPRAHDTRRIRYRVRFEDGDPAGVFVSGPTQEVRPIDDHTAELIVRAIRPQPSDEAESPERPAEDPPEPAELKPNNLIQSDDPTVVAMAKEAAGGEKDPWKVAVALERYVNDQITSKSFSQAFASAAEVAKTKEGDCTEHAVLLAALARARGIPARVAVGLVYMPMAHAFGYHMWTELYIRGQWIPMDATIGRGGIGAAHLKLAHSSLKGASAYSSFLPVVQVGGRLKLEILEVE